MIKKSDGLHQLDHCHWLQSNAWHNLSSLGRKQHCQKQKAVTSLHAVVPVPNLIDVGHGFYRTDPILTSQWVILDDSSVLNYSVFEAIPMWKRWGANGPNGSMQVSKYFQRETKRKQWKRYTKMKSINNLNKFKSLWILCKKGVAKGNFSKQKAENIEDNPNEFKATLNRNPRAKIL